jgi:hypothetical protein
VEPGAGLFVPWLRMGFIVAKKLQNCTFHQEPATLGVGTVTIFPTKVEMSSELHGLGESDFRLRLNVK